MKNEIAGRERGEMLAHARTLIDDRLGNNGCSLAFPEPPPPSRLFGDTQKKYFLDLLFTTDSLAAAASLSGFSPSTVSTHIKEDEEFGRAYEMLRVSVRTLRRIRTRNELERRGIEGYNRQPVLDRDGKPVIDPETNEVVYKTQYSDTALSKLVDLDFPEIKKDGPLVEVNTSGVIKIPAKRSAEEFEAEFGKAKAPPTDVDFEDAE